MFFSFRQDGILEIYLKGQGHSSVTEQYEYRIHFEAASRHQGIDQSEHRKLLPLEMQSALNQSEHTEDCLTLAEVNIDQSASSYLDSVK
jgi:hypothetical protein